MEGQDDERKFNNMATKKTKISIKVRDLMPAKDAIGGRHGHHGHHGHQFSSLLSEKGERVPRRGMLPV